MLEWLREDYTKTTPMIFGIAPTFDAIQASIDKLNTVMNKL
jgi:hypothetical protein